ncbi:MAG: DUF927 domain-containing protein [Nitrosospira sp.]
MSVDFSRVKAAALASIESVLPRWTPGGKRQGREYMPLNPTRSDSKPGSFSINLDTGAWSDFATGEKGGDLVALVAYIDGVSQGEAANRLAAFLGLNPEKPDSPGSPTSAQKHSPHTRPSTTAKKNQWLAVLPVPIAAPKPPESHYQHGKPAKIWEYRNPSGELLCLVYRFEPIAPGERKQFYPLTWCRNSEGKCEWRWQGLPEPRPLYRGDQLVARSNAIVIIAEGEKAADAAAVLFPDGVGTTPLNGAQSPHKTDWTPLAGRHVLLWPDNDTAGMKCMEAIAQLVREAGAREVRLINIAAFAQVPGRDGAGQPTLSEGTSLPEKWDAADALADGWTADHVQLLCSTSYQLFRVAEVKRSNGKTKAATGAQHELEPPQKRFHCNDQGVWYFGMNDAGTDTAPLWICSKLEITAVTRDAKNESWGRLLEFDDPDNTHHIWAMPMEMLKGDGTEYRGILLSMGLQISPMQKARNLLTQYIQTAQVEDRARCVERTGWHDRVFVMPQRTIGRLDERILYQSQMSAPSTFKHRGNLTDWQQHIAAECAGNSRLVFAICAAFAAPLLHVTGMESGGLHYRGDSSTGKTTALRVAASVWGGNEYLQRWRATDNGLEALASQYSDCLLVLDELSQVDPRAAGEVAYMLANGSGKARANRMGTMRSTASWRVLFLSSGEAGLAEHMAQANRKSKAGQEVRLLDIPADAAKGLGLFDTLHDHESGAVFSKVLAEATTLYYGSAAPAFIGKLVEHLDKLPSMIKKAQREFTNQHLPSDAGGQAHRAALRFSLVGAAGELATVWGITGWKLGEASEAAKTCFLAWMAHRGGGGNQEAAAMLAQVRQFFELHGDARFTEWDRATDDHAPKTVNRAGFRRKDDVSGETEYFVLPEVFRSEVCKGFDYKAICRLLADTGALRTEGKSFTRKERLPGMGNTSCYRITAKLWGGDHE